jgi:tetratricopeptide (TPR) repeat protein
MRVRKPADIEILIRQERWTEAERAIRGALKIKPDDHWLVTRLASTLYEQGQFKRSLIYASRAVDLAPYCPLALWDLAGTLQMLERHQEALAIYRRIVKRGYQRIAVEPCGEGLARSRGLVADCHLRISDSLRLLGREALSMRHFGQHLDMRGPGCHSIYSLADISRKRAALKR